MPPPTETQINELDEKNRGLCEKLYELHPKEYRQIPITYQALAYVQNALNISTEGPAELQSVFQSPEGEVAVIEGLIKQLSNETDPTKARAVEKGGIIFFLKSSIKLAEVENNSSIAIIRDVLVKEKGRKDEYTAAKAYLGGGADRPAAIGIPKTQWIQKFREMTRQEIGAIIDKYQTTESLRGNLAKNLTEMAES